MLNARQEMFCLEYAKCGNATESAKRAGYSEKTAKSIGQRLLTYVDVKNRLQELSKITEDAKIADIKEMQQVLTAIIRQEATEEVIVLNSIKGTFDKTNKKPSLKEVINAIEKLGKMQGAFTDKVELEITPVVIRDDVDESD